MPAFELLATSARQAKVATELSNRPWAVPDEPWSQAQTLEDVVFAHWRVDPGVLARLLPYELAVDAYEGDAWLGVVALRVTNLRLRGLLPLPWVSSFAEVNVRTYVTLEDRPGIWFFSTLLSSALVAEAAKRRYRLPTRGAQIDARATGGELCYELAEPDAALDLRARGAGRATRSAAGTLEHFLTERFCLYTADGGRLYRAEVHHRPWRLRRATGTVRVNTVAPLAVSDEEPHLLVAASQDILSWRLEEL